MKNEIRVIAVFTSFVILAAGGLHAADAVRHQRTGATELRLPAEGRWSIATAWSDGWPAQWRHASAERTETAGEWTIFHGHIDLPGGRWILRDAMRQTAEGRLECRRRWEWAGDTTLDQVTLSARWQVRCEDARPFLPSISYYGNPAGQTVDASRIPVIGDQPGDGGYYEEHRFSMPLASVEATADQRLIGAALHSVPSPLRDGHYEDQWWSLGLSRLDDGIELALLSGAVASNRRNGVIKAEQRSFVDYPDAYLTVPPGTIIEKQFFVQLYPVASRGAGFQSAVWQAVELSRPFSFYGFPPVRDVIRRKFLDTTNRWHEDDKFAGFDAFPDTRGVKRAWIDLGWAGQSEAAAYPLILLGQKYEVPDALRFAQESLDFISTSPFDGRGFSIRYDYDAHRWLARRNPLSQAQAMNNMLNALRVARRTKSMDVSAWENFLRRASDFHADRLADKQWSPVSTNEAFLIAPLAQSAELLNEPRYLEAARTAADHYGDRHLSMDEPYWGGTLDARCEDKEGAWAALQGFLAVYEATRERKYLNWAAHAADVVISYVYVWDVPMPPGRLADHAFRSRGWTSVSVQNMHLDVYGVLCSPALWRLGELLSRDKYKQMARLMFVACGQLVDAKGGQGEQLHQTNYAQHYRVTELKGVRGDYVESWNVFWISAHFLTAAAQFAEMGVDYEQW